ncbi:MAG: hypothetical protein QNJ51_00950 [Calothrix sp. MO_167.B12]|nr:hypothetical protein [Calothrix sp. MO_167.B12]
MSLINNRGFKHLAYMALSTSLLAMLANFNGIVTVRVTPWRIMVVVNGSPPRCLIDPQIPEGQFPEQKFAKHSRISGVHEILINLQV